MRFADIQGHVFGRLTTISFESGTNQKPGKWICQCVCGQTTKARTVDLQSGRKQSCGCLQKEATSKAKKTHGMAGTSIYRIWTLMIQRCENPKRPAYKDYGGRGIAVCPEWRESFEAFIADVGDRPKGHTLDRIDNSLGYFPQNCRWATWDVQARNRRTAKNRTSDGRIEYDGRNLLPVEWGEIVGQSSNTIRERIRRGWSPGRALGFE